MVKSYILPRHMPAIDGLRGVAILMVVLTHACSGWLAAWSITQDRLARPPTLNLPGWLSNIGENGMQGVTLFFVVSAFTLTLSMAHSSDLGRYALRRIARVGPGYWLAGIAYTLAAGLGPRLWAPDGISLPDLALAAVFGSAWQGRAAMAVVPGGWSISCEVAFYAALPLLLWLIQGRIWRAALLTMASCIFVQLVFRYFDTHGGWHFPEYIYPGAQAPVFLFGITGALIIQRVRLPEMPSLTLSLLAFAVLALPFSPIMDGHVLRHFQFAALATLIVSLAAARPPALLASAVMRGIGEVSYSMYLIHFAVLAPSLAFAERLAPGDGWETLALHFGLTAGCSFVLACLTYRWIEQPCIQWAARWVRPAASDTIPAEKSRDAVTRGS